MVAPPPNSYNTTRDLANGDRVTLESGSDIASFEIQTIRSAQILVSNNNTVFDLDKWRIIDIEYTVPTYPGIYISYVNDRAHPDVVMLYGDQWTELNSKVPLHEKDILMLMPLTRLVTMGQAVNLVKNWVEKEHHNDWPGPLRDSKETLSKSIGDRYRGER